MTDRGDISNTIIAKSDQLNACDLFAGPINVTVQKVDVASNDQPVIIHIGEGRQPFKPCLGMRRVLAKLWGKYSADWVGKSMTLYCDDDVLWAGKAVGGIRISHMSHIKSKEIVVIRASKHSTVNYEIMPLSIDLPAYTDGDIKKNKAAWIESFSGKKTTPVRLIASIKTKFTLTDKQEQEILDMATEKIDTETGEITEPQATEVTEKQLEALLNDADSPESIDDVEGMIDGLPSEAAKKRIVAICKMRREELSE